MISTKQSLKLLLLISRLIGILMGMVTGIFLIFALMALLGLLPDKLTGTYELPIILENPEAYYTVEELHPTYQCAEIEVKNANIEIMPISNNGAQALLFILAAIYTGLNYLILYKLSGLLETFQSPTPFKRANARYIRHIGLLTLAFPLYKYLIGGGVSLYFQNYFTIQHASITSFTSIWEINFPIIFLGLIILVLAEVFKIGADLQELEEQTV